MNTHFTYNFVEKTIVGSKRSIDRANKGLSPEYAELTKMMAEHPDFAVTVKIIKANNNKKTYKHFRNSLFHENTPSNRLITA